VTESGHAAKQTNNEGNSMNTMTDLFAININSHSGAFCGNSDITENSSLNDIVDYIDTHLDFESDLFSGDFDLDF
jgi:hypothetical protein